MRIVFMGTPEYAVVSLRALIEEGFEVVGVFTQPDRPRGRGKQVLMPPVKELAQKHQIPVFQPARIRTDGLEDLKALQPNLCVTAAFGQILSEDILAVPLLGTVNVHASLLPAYRGSSPANWVIINGEAVTGVTTMMTDKGIDTGDILLQTELPIKEGETAGELTLRLSHAGAELLIETLRKIKNGTCPRRKQDETRMSYYPLLSRETGVIDWTMPAKAIQGLVYGTNPWPSASTDSPWGKLKIHAALAEKQGRICAPGTILQASPKTGLFVQTGDGALRILELQAPGKRAMDSCAFLRGNPLTGPGMMTSDEGVS
ncbi:MAG: methionyl-tRNA formyltransferase [Clostridiales bacterium]|nr:methionyl-tRNA formyltransferase [Clostridiales bacterium]